MLYDLTPSTIAGIDGEFLCAPRIDNQVSCWAGLQALIATPADATPSAVLCLFDHEEVGSTSAQGASSTLLPTVLERIAGSRQALHPALARSLCVSADGAHATHPNYPERHEPDHHIAIGEGPGYQAQRQPALRHRCSGRGRVRRRLRKDRSGPPDIRPPGRYAVWQHHRPVRRRYHRG